MKRLIWWLIQLVGLAHEFIMRSSASSSRPTTYNCHHDYMITFTYRNVDKHLHLSLNNTPEHAGSEGKKSGEVKTNVAPNLTPPHLSLSTTRAASATSSATQHAVNGDNLCGYVCWFMSHAASHRPSSSISQEDRGTPDWKPPPRPPLVSNSQTTPRKNKPEPRLCFHWHRPPTSTPSVSARHSSA